MDRLRAHLPFIQTLASAEKPKTFEYFLDQLNATQLLLLRDIVRNFLRGNFKVSDNELKELKNKRGLLRRFIHSSSSLKTQRNLVKQAGSGVFSILIPALASVLIASLR